MFIYCKALCIQSNIEHFWSSLSKKLSGVQFSPRVDGDDKPPCQVSGITAEEHRQKEAIVFDKVIDELCSIYWAGATFNGYPYNPVHIKCISEEAVYKGDDEIHSFLRCPICDIKEGKFSGIKEEMEMMLKHIKEMKLL